MEQAIAYKTWVCSVCGLVYNEEEGWPDEGVAPGTRWEDIPEDWCCPECHESKRHFAMVEI